MSSFLSVFLKMPSAEKSVVLKDNGERFANTVVFSSRITDRGLLLKKAYPFLTKEIKNTIYKNFNERKKTTPTVDFIQSVNFYRLFKNEDFSHKILKDAMRQITLFNTNTFDENKDIIGLLYTSSIFDKGSEICGKDLIINDAIYLQPQKRQEVSLLNTILTAVPFEKNINKFKLKFDAKDEVKKINDLANKYEDEIFVKDMALEAMGLAVPKNDNLLLYGIDPRHHDKVKEYQRKAHDKMLLKISEHHVDTHLKSKIPC